jgi:hypothetical protein
VQPDAQDVTAPTAFGLHGALAVSKTMTLAQASIFSPGAESRAWRLAASG